MVGFEKVEKRCMSLYGSTIQIYKTYNTTLLKVLPASGKLGFILIRCLRSSKLVCFRHEIRQITPEMLQNLRNACTIDLQFAKKEMVPILNICCIK
jgi:hypothetical protein